MTTIYRFDCTYLRCSPRVRVNSTEVVEVDHDKEVVAVFEEGVGG